MTTQIYQVKSGESLSKIAEKVFGDQKRWPELAYANSLSHPYFIYPGQLLEIPQKSDTVVIDIVAPKVKKKPETTPAVAAPITAGFSINPATVILLAVGAALLLGKR